MGCIVLQRNKAGRKQALVAQQVVQSWEKVCEIPIAEQRTGEPNYNIAKEAVREWTPEIGEIMLDPGVINDSFEDDQKNKIDTKFYTAKVVNTKQIGSIVGNQCNSKQNYFPI